MDKRAPARSHVSLSQAFRAQGIRLKFPTRSRSGIRWEESGALLTLVVERRGAEYWASWGTTALRQRGLHQIPPEPATPIRAFAGPRG
jgi:hypothetical protein